MENIKTVIIVVTYGKTKISNKTLESLMSVNLKKKHDLIIFNNGPVSINDSCFECVDLLKKKFKAFSLYEDLSNAPLSSIYNYFLEENDYDRYILLDDDTMFPSCFFDDMDETLLEHKFLDLQLPRIIENSNKKQYYPRCGRNIIEPGPLNEKDEFFSVGSGLIIYKSLIEKFKKNNIELFDTRFALYGVDYSFFRRLRMLRKKGVFFNIVVNSEIFHSMSSVNPKVEQWRKKERMYDHVLTIKHYGGMGVKYLKLFKLILHYLNTKDLMLVIYSIEVYIKGIHPRCLDQTRKSFSRSYFF
ncbi:hypothetical protein M2Y83_25860 [Klebsiella pneumoniae]|nr:hypothetical protein [Klebsiella pneumoniae]MDZ1970714.1 hypothetical protein [Klebsiella pneumoniae]